MTPGSQVKHSTTESRSFLRYCIEDQMRNEVVQYMIGTIYRWPLKYSVYKLYTDIRATKPLMQNYAYQNACIQTIWKEISALAEI